MSALPAAVDAAMRELQRRPESPAAWTRLGVALDHCGQHASAARAFAQVHRRAPSATNTARWFQAALAAGDLNTAQAVLEAAPASLREPATAWRRLAEAAGKRRLPVLALSAWSRAVLLAPDDIELRILAGVSAGAAGQGIAGLDHLSHAARLAPDNADVWANMAVLADQCGRPGQAGQAAASAMRLRPGDPHASLVLARQRRRSGDPEGALALLAGDGFARGGLRCAARGWGERGRALDALDDTTGAFAAFAEMNRIAQQRPERDPAGMQRWRDQLAASRAAAPALLAAAKAPWQPPPDGPPPVFVCGFPRSGTTLLSSLLGAHPALVATDETPALDVVVAQAGRLLGRQGSYPEAVLPLLHTPAARQALRAAYRQAFALHRPGLPTGLRVVDKMPFNLIHLPLISALFPDARLICIHRDCRDTALSCFMQDFVHNDAMGHMTDMQSIADLQASALGAWIAARSGPVLPVREIWYEELVADPAGSMRGLVSWLGLEWDDRVLDASRRTADQHITTPSYDRVGGAIDARAVARWTRYAAALRPWQARLDQTQAELRAACPGAVASDPSE